MRYNSAAISRLFRAHRLEYGEIYQLNSGEEDAVSFCEHCAGQRFDRAQVLRTLRAARKRLPAQQRGSDIDEALCAAIEAVRALDIPHLEFDDEVAEGQTVH
jgi:hypothetical protein